MTVYCLVDEAPEEFGGFRLISVYLKKEKAWERLKGLMERGSYTYQYYGIVTKKVLIFTSTMESLPKR